MPGISFTADELVWQVNDPVNDHGTMKPNWVNVLTQAGKMNRVNAKATFYYQQEGVTLTHRWRCLKEPAWVPLRREDRGYPWPGTVRGLFTDRSGHTRVLVFQGGGTPYESGRWYTYHFSEESPQQQFPR
jgi:hypothetical protein